MSDQDNPLRIALIHFAEEVYQSEIAYRTNVLPHGLELSVAQIKGPMRNCRWVWRGAIPTARAPYRTRSLPHALAQEVGQDLRGDHQHDHHEDDAHGALVVQQLSGAADVEAEATGTDEA